MSQKNYLTVSASVFTIIALVHLARVLFSWPVTIGMTSMPNWASVVAVVVAGLLAYYGFKNSN